MIGIQHIRFLIAIMSFVSTAFAQIEKKHIADGNKMYEEGKFEEAEKEYSKAIDLKADLFEGKFNTADALFRQEKYEDAAREFNNIATSTEDKADKAKAFHNLGNSLLMSQKLEESIDAYKQALRNNPKDDATRYNLAYALRMKQQQQQQEKKDKKEDKDKKDENQEKKENEEKKDEEQQQDEEKKEDQQEEQQQKPKPEQLSKEDAERLLDALENEEKKVQERLKKKKLKGPKVTIEKDW